jgi:hypothetical protein
MPGSPRKKNAAAPRKRRSAGSKKKLASRRSAKPLQSASSKKTRAVSSTTIRAAVQTTTCGAASRPKNVLLRRRRRLRLVAGHVRPVVLVRGLPVAVRQGPVDPVLVLPAQVRLPGAALRHRRDHQRAAWVPVLKRGAVTTTIVAVSVGAPVQADLVPVQSRQRNHARSPTMAGVQS